MKMSCSVLLGVLTISTFSFSLGQAYNYIIYDEKIGDLKTKILYNQKTGERAEIVVDFGGRVESLTLLSQSLSNAQPQQVLLSHNGNGTAIKENQWWKGMLLVPWANRIAYGRYTFFNKTYQLPLNENKTNPPLKNALHGLLAGKIMDHIEQTYDDEKAALVLGLDIKGAEGYPFSFHYEARYTLSKAGFDIQITIVSLMGNQTLPVPVYIGWHPYFVCTPYKSVITFDNCTNWNHVYLDKNSDPNGFTDIGTPFDGKTPIGGTPGTPTAYDDEYKATEPPSRCGAIKTKLFDPDTKKTIVLHQSENMRFVHVFTGVEGAVAMEPMSGMADAFNNHDHLSILSTQETFEASFGVYLE